MGFENRNKLLPFQLGKTSQKIKRKKLCTRNIKFIINPPKNLEMRFVYRMPGDVYIQDHFSIGNNLVSIFKDLRIFKKVISVFHDTNKKIVGCYMIDNYKYVPPIQLLIHRLQSLGESDAYNLSKTIEQIVELKNILKRKKISKKFMIDEIYERPSYKEFLNKNEELINKYNEEYPIIIWHRSNFDDLTITRAFNAGLNYKILMIIGEDINNFAYKLMKKGIPECLYVERDYLPTLNHILNSIFYAKNNEDNFDYFFKTKNSKLRAQRMAIANKFEEDNFTEVFLIEIFKIEENDFKFKNESLLRKNEEATIDSFLKIHKDLNIILENDSMKEGNIKMIQNYYPDIKITVLDCFEQEKGMRCGFKLF